MSAPIGRVAVLGLGLIGGSLVRALTRHGLDVTGFDSDTEAAVAADAAGFPVATTEAEAVRDAALVMLAMPLPQLPAALRSVGPHLRDDAVLTDVGTLKAPVLSAVRQIAPAARFVGGHPLAGTEESGWGAGETNLFDDAPWTLTLESDTDLDAWLTLADLLCELGARPVPTSVVEQDAAVARVIGLPHVLAETLALTGLAGGPLGLSLAAGSYRSGSRVARTRPELVATWCDGNPSLVSALDDVIGRLVAARDHLAAGQSMLDLANAGHSARIGWEHRRVEQVELVADPAVLREHGRRGGWVTAVVRDGGGSGAPITRLLGMRPVD